MRFRHFIEVTEEADDIQRTLGKIPKAHAALVKGYKWIFQAGNTLKGDDEHIGCIDHAKHTITVAGPWNYGREYTILHEIGHQVWERLDDNAKKQWAKIAANTQHKQNQAAEELFCMAYANTYAKNKIVIHTHPEWEKFVQNIPDISGVESMKNAISILKTQEKRQS
jgi:hypothetical protein